MESQRRQRYAYDVGEFVHVPADAVIVAPGSVFVATVIVGSAVFAGGTVPLTIPSVLRRSMYAP